MNLRIKAIILLISIFGFCKFGNAQTSQQKVDTTKSPLEADSLRLTSNNLIEAGGDIELSEISIEAVIEKPQVAILPKRLEPELGAMEFVDRSFEQELKRVPENLMIRDNRLFVPKKIENLKQRLIERKEQLEKTK